MPYVLNEVSYKTKDEIKKRAQRIIADTSLHELITGDDYEFLVSLFENHDGWTEKKGTGFNGISIRVAPEGTRCFYLQTNEGSVNISFHHAVLCLKKM